MGDPQEKPPFTPVKAHFVPSQQRGRDVAVYIFPDDHELCYEWFCQLQLVDGVTFLYMCCGCKSLKSRDPHKYSRPVASCRIVDGYFITDPCNPKRPHFCEPRLTTKATARRLIIGKCNELRGGGTGSRPAAQELDDLLLRISSEEFGGFTAEERATMIKQIVCPSEYGRDNARRIIQRAQQRARQGDTSNATVCSSSYDNNPDAPDDLFAADKKPQKSRVNLCLCIVCGEYREFFRSQMPPFNRHNVLVLIAVMMNYKDMSLDSAKNIYSGCSLKHKIICKQHYLDAAVPLLSDIVPTVDNIPFDYNLNALYIKEDMISEDVVSVLNERSSQLDDREKLTAKSVTSFLNDTFACCLDKKKRDRRGEKRVGTTGQLKSIKAPRKMNSTQLCIKDATGEFDPEHPDNSGNPEDMASNSAAVPECSNANADSVDHDSEEIVVDDDVPHISKDVMESLAAPSGSVKRIDPPQISKDVVESVSASSGSAKRVRMPPRHNAPITAKKMMETINVTPPTLPPEEIPKLGVPWPDRLFIVEGRQLLELFRFCPLCGTELEASGSSFKCSSEGNNPVVDVHCQVCMDKRGNIGRWKGYL